MTSGDTETSNQRFKREKCVHYWKLESAKVKAVGVCIFCGELRRFTNSRQGPAKILAKNVWLSIQGRSEAVPVYVYPSTNLRNLVKLAGLGCGQVLVNGVAFTEDQKFFNALNSGDRIHLEARNGLSDGLSDSRA